MKKTYKTTFEIEAEQFDGSYEMAKEYEMVMSLAGVYYVDTFDGVKEIREGDWLISNGEDNIAIADDDYFKEHYELVEDDEPTDGLAKVTEEYQGEERQAEESRMSTLISQLVLEVGCMDNKLGQIQDELRQQEKIRRNEMAAKSRAYVNFIDELTDVLENNHLL